MLTNDALKPKCENTEKSVECANVRINASSTLMYIIIL